MRRSTRRQQRGGGIVLLPAGSLGFSTQIRNHANGVQLTGLGIGQVRSNVQPSSWQAVTKFVWIGSYAGAGSVGVDWSPSGNTPLRSAGIWDIVFDCQWNVDTCVRMESTEQAFIKVGGAQYLYTCTGK